MHFSIELFFDRETSEAVQHAWRTLAEVSGSDYLLEHGVYPHLALSVFEADGIGPAEMAFKNCISSFRPFRLTPSGIGSSLYWS